MLLTHLVVDTYGKVAASSQAVVRPLLRPYGSPFPKLGVIHRIFHCDGFKKI